MCPVYMCTSGGAGYLTDASCTAWVRRVPMCVCARKRLFLHARALVCVPVCVWLTGEYLRVRSVCAYRCARGRMRGSPRKRLCALMRALVRSFARTFTLPNMRTGNASLDVHTTKYAYW